MRFLLTRKGLGVDRTCLNMTMFFIYYTLWTSAHKSSTVRFFHKVDLYYLLDFYFEKRIGSQANGKVRKIVISSWI